MKTTRDTRWRALRDRGECRQGHGRTKRRRHGRRRRAHGGIARRDPPAIVGRANMTWRLENIAARCSSPGDRAVSRARDVFDAVAAS
ncbi:hypothetical protein AQ808_27495 [Burkholderia pseudomallei]|uniref:hypothetical protein n=1 Tax=Burkholderia pseudomallei TaxID=28450 RepID=UPI0005726037|nr:hypothetical protein [Burkholderia pseudomallei]OMW43109.1 hypothetical protein AQ808_27495 [Burkholderia pseudomallei]